MIFCQHVTLLPSDAFRCHFLMILKWKLTMMNKVNHNQFKKIFHFYLFAEIEPLLDMF